ncbi:nitroreductase family protein [Isachenkonia alkalipeptolytica]|uniref:Nitroreductase n=1 Tax=Isachenkonia alkalipeptolytica TaxID=2565777 RepID=A0AA43XK26_9CLOT|nr:nitroreductase family protein [Isachenkonia alkalipeptolytica]NBG88278.1 nitroreductase [Isachenkonia alkalipeptolytica]
MEPLDFIYKRHSVRKFKEAPVPNEDIKEIINAATYAPSGKNRQNWHFVVVKNREVIEKMSRAIEKKGKELVAGLPEEKSKEFLKYLPFYSFFTKAPVTVLVFAGPYPTTGADLLRAKGASEEEIRELEKHNPGIQNVAAAMENLLLAAANLGYGTCWMTGPNFAAEEIQEVVGFQKEGYYLAAMTPLGVPEEKELWSPKRKPLEEVLDIIE